MSSGIPDLWPQDLEITSVLSPLAIMRHQASQLRVKTKNFLEAEVRSNPKDPKNSEMSHDFVLIAPALDRYEYVLFRASHGEAMVYPVYITSNILHEFGQENVWVASTQEVFYQLIAKLFASGTARSVIQSLIARSNEIKIES